MEQKVVKLSESQLNRIIKNIINESTENEQDYKIVGDYHDGCARVIRKDYKMNFIDSVGKILSKEWFEFVEDFANGFAKVQREDDFNWNFIDTDGEELSDEYFRDVDDFYNGYARVQREDGTMNFINTDGEILSKEWFKNVGFFGDKEDGFAMVRREDGTWNFINTDGEILSKEKFKDVDNFEDGFAAVQREDGEWYLLNTNGQICDYNTKQPIQEPTNENKQINRYKNMEQKRIVRLTESKLNRIIKKCLNEAGRQPSDTFIKLEQIIQNLEDIRDSGLIAFSSPNPSSTEKQLKESIEKAIMLLDIAKACYTSLYIC